jgi:exonuclease VII small subunit
MSETKSLREILTSLDSIKLDFEMMHEKIESSIKIHENVTDFLETTVPNFEEIIKSQNHASELLKKNTDTLKTTDDDLKKSTADYIESASNLFKIIERGIKSQIENSFRDVVIPTEKIEKKIEEKLEILDFAPVQDLTEKMNELEKRIFDSYQNISNLEIASKSSVQKLEKSADTLNKKIDEIDSYSEKIEDLKKTISSIKLPELLEPKSKSSFLGYFFTLAIGLIGGFTLMYVLKGF